MIDKNIPWLPNGEMKDGTLIFGPCKTRPDVSGAIHELIVDGNAVYVSLCCNKPILTEDEHNELMEFCRKMLSV